MKNLTPQEIFDVAFLGIVRQGKPSVNSFGSCLYRAPDGSKCAVGQLIPDELYDPVIERCGVSSIRSQSMGKNPTALESIFRETGLIEHVQLMQHMQEAHDSASDALLDGEDFLQEFIERMSFVAGQHGLVLPSSR